VVISGTATGSTGIVINDTNPGGGGYNPTGITIAAVNGASTNAFQLTGVTGGSPGEVVQPARGPMGAIKKGIWFYPLLQTTVPGDGLSAAGSEYRLFGLPDIEAFMLPYAVTGAQNVFFDTAADWLDRQDDLRRWIRRNGFRARSAAGGGADMPDRSAPGYISSTGPGVWVKAGGSWSNRKASADVGSILPAAAGLGSFDLSFKQNTYSLMGGVDFGQEAVLSPADTMVWGLMAGYIDSRLNFKNSSNSFKYTGATVGASATYLNGGWFADALIKADFLKLSLDFPSLISGGFTPTRVDATTYGLVANTGYRFQWGHRGQTYFEPGLTLAYAKTHIDNVTLMGTTAEFNKAESLRGAAGARIGTVVQETATHVVDASFYGKYWNEFTGKAGVLLTSTGPALALEDTRAKGYTDLGIIIDLANKGTGWSGFVSGGMKFNKEFSTTVVKTGIRYLW
jgi:hypothetical protein